MTGTPTATTKSARFTSFRRFFSRLLLGSPRLLRCVFFSLTPVDIPLPFALTVGGGPFVVGGWRKNALRHSYGSYRAAQIKDLQALAIEMGTSYPMIEKHYREAVTPATAEAFWSLTPSEVFRKDFITGLKPTA